MYCVFTQDLHLWPCFCFFPVANRIISAKTPLGPKNISPIEHIKRYLFKLLTGHQTRSTVCIFKIQRERNPVQSVTLVFLEVLVVCRHIFGVCSNEDSKVNSQQISITDRELISHTASAAVSRLAANIRGKNAQNIYFCILVPC